MTTLRYCPQCASEQRNGTMHPFVCTKCNFTLFHNTAAAVAGIIEVDNQILFTQRAKNPGAGMLDLPGGFVDPNEPLEKALSREVQEELRLEISSWKYLCSFPNEYHYKDVIYYTCDSIFYCKLNNMPQLQLEQQEISQVLWQQREGLDVSEMAFKSLQQAVLRYLEK